MIFNIKDIIRNEECKEYLLFGYIRCIAKNINKNIPNEIKIICKTYVSNIKINNNKKKKTPKYKIIHLPDGSVDVVGNDITGDTIDPTTVSLVDPGTAINIVTDANGDITSYEIPGEGTWNVDLATGEITFDPEDGFILSPTPITYNVEDDEGNLLTELLPD